MGQTQTAEGVLTLTKADLKGKVAIVTGSSAGIGVETARVLAKGGSRVILACRGREKAEKAAEGIRKSIADVKDAGTVEFLELDLIDLDNVRTFAKNFLALDIPLHYLVLNAGMTGDHFKRSPQGYEGQFATNHLGHFLLTTLLLDKLKASVPSRVVTVASAVHKKAVVYWDSTFLSEGKDWQPGRAYGQSKICNILFANELDRLLAEDAKTRDAKERVLSVSLHPGVIATELARDSVKFTRLLKIVKPFLKTIPQGAATTIYCCIAPNVEGGKYYSDCAVAKVVPHASVTPLDKAATRLWEISEKLVNTKFVPKEETKKEETKKEETKKEETEPKKEETEQKKEETPVEENKEKEKTTEPEKDKIDEREGVETEKIKESDEGEKEKIEEVGSGEVTGDNGEKPETGDN